MARETACEAIAVPAPLSADLTGYRWARDLVGESGGAVYRLSGRRGASDLFLKHGQGSVADDITDEMVRLRWLGGHVPVPAVRGFVQAGDEAWLLMTAMPGRTAFQMLEAGAGAELVDALAQFMLRLHAIPVATCPFNSDHLLRLAHARQRIDAGLVDTEDFDVEREGWSAERVWSALQDHLPLPGDRVVTHGDFSLDNILIAEGRVAGCIDAGRVGVADRYQDLAILWNRLGEFDPALQARLFEEYGLAEPDPSRLAFHLLLDELF